MNNPGPTEEVSRTGLRERLTHAREQRGYSTRDLSNLIGVTDGTISKWEAGQSTPRANRLPVLAGALGVSMRWLMSGDDDLGAKPRNDAPHRDMERLLADLRDVKKSYDISLRRLADIERRLSSAVLETDEIRRREG